jgi:hypothetical protein
MPKTGLRVAIADDSVNVSRLDGRPLQFGVISGEFGRLTTHLVPPEPTASITYQAAGRNKWTVSSELDITIPDDGAPQRIAAAIIRFVSAKQSQ